MEGGKADGAHRDTREGKMIPSSSPTLHHVYSSPRERPVTNIIPWALIAACGLAVIKQAVLN